jgi:hypothetical protein
MSDEIGQVFDWTGAARLTKGTAHADQPPRSKSGESRHTSFMGITKHFGAVEVLKDHRPVGLARANS